MELDRSEVLLSHFVPDVSVLYGKQYLTFNVHQLRHLALSVKRWGPHWATWAFLFEDRNGELTRVAKGTQAIDKQLGMLVSIGNSLRFIEKYVNKSSLEEFLLKKLKNIHFSKPVASAGSVKFHGKSSCASDGVTPAILTYVGNHDVRHIQHFKKVTIGSQTFWSKLNNHQIRRNNTVARYTFESCVHYGVIQSFCKAGESAFGVVKKFDVESCRYEHTETGYVLLHIVPVKLSSAAEVIKLPCKMQKCVFL